MEEHRSLRAEKCNCFALRRGARLATNLYDERLKPTGLRITQFLALVAIQDSPGLSVNGLAEQLDLDRTTAGNNLLVLERDGLIRVTRSARDAKTKVIELTRLGEDRVGEAMPLWRSAQQELEEIMQSALPALRSALDRAQA